MSDRHLRRQRWRLLNNLVQLLEPLMALLGIVWLLLFVVDLTRGLGPTLTAVNQAIWAMFVLDFAAELAVAPSKGLYLRRHWITALSLALPAVRVARLARVTRVARVTRGARLVRAVGSFNRGMAALRATMRRRGAAYVAGLTFLTTIAAAAAIFAFENQVPDPGGIHDFGTALWWTAMMMTTMGSAYWPETAEGRILCVLLALYSFGVFGYVTAALSTFFIDRDAARGDTAVAGERSLDALRSEIAQLRVRLDRLGPPRDGT